MKPILSIGILFLVGITGCKPDYPACDGDKDCKEGEFCVNKLCQQCRDNNDCKAGQTCNKGRCETGTACSTAADCPPGQGCKDGRCGPCDSDAQCGPGGRCQNGKCARTCTTDADCPEGEECQNGLCTGPPGAGAGDAPCKLEPVYFDFNESLLTTEATSALSRNVECLKLAAGRNVRAEGHCDARGTEDYNMALGDRRARAVIDHLKRLAADTSRVRPVSRGKLDASGSDETGFARDRRVEMIFE